MIYLASPYTHKSFTVMHDRYLETKAFVATHIKRDKLLFSPIVYCHEMARRYNMPTDADFWWNFNRGFLLRAHSLWVLQIDGWQKSKGVRQEIDWWLETHPQAVQILCEREGTQWVEYTKTG